MAFVLDAADVETVSQWLATASRSQAWFHELHVDQLPSVGGQRDRWLEAGVLGYHAAIDLRNQWRLPLGIAMVISLVDVGGPAQVSSREALNRAMSHTPPALYIMPVDGIPEPEHEAQPIQLTGVDIKNGSAYYQSNWRAEYSECYPYIIVVSESGDL